MKRFFFLLTLICFLPGGLLSQLSRITITEKKWLSLTASVIQAYNDNILDYSPGDISHITDTARATKFDLVRAEDAITTLRGRIEVKHDFFDNMTTSVSFRFARNMYATNTIRNYNTWGVGFRQEMFARTFLSLRYSAFSDYYLRNIFYRRYRTPSRQRSHYIQQWFRKKSITADLGMRVTSRLTATIGYANESSTYNPEFTERDNQSNGVTISIDYKASRVLKFGGDYNYSQSRARGGYAFELIPFDSLSDISDIRREFALSAAINLKPVLKIPVVYSLKYLHSNQRYRSDKVFDIFHYGRVDNYNKLVSEINYDIVTYLDVSIIYIWEENKSNLNDTNDAGSFQTHQISLGVEYIFQI